MSWKANNLIYNSMSTAIITILLLGLLSSLIAAKAPVYKPGDSLYTFLWNQSLTDQNDYGYYVLGKITDTIRNKDSITCNAKYSILQLPWWKQQIPADSGTINFIFWDGKPPSVLSCSKRFDSTYWLCAINKIQKPTNNTIRFYFPILPSNQAYALYNYFTVKYNDTMNIEFQVVSDSVVTGSFVNKKSVGNEKTILYAKNAIVIKTTAAFPLRIKTVHIDAAFASLVSSYIGFDLVALKKDVRYYGVEALNPKTDVVISSFTPMPVSKLSLQAFQYNKKIKVIYSLPLDIQRIQFTLFDLKGRGVLNTQTTEYAVLKAGSFEWSKSLSNGYYILEMKATLRNSETPFILRSMVLYVR
ncbi:MAG: hypothetical protein JW795_05695 [Chitinivibrionales bacterium]|nr:hypothetical protein [Chitinivibrionales bacterium]